MKKGEFSIMIDGIEVTGKITQLDKFYIEVEILQPYVNWSSFLAIGGLCRRTPNHFLSEHGEKYAQRILTESYKKIKFLDENIDRAVKDYDKLIDEIKAASVLDNDLEKRIIKKLRDHFFRNQLFVSSVTGLTATYYDEPKIEEIIKTYKTEKKKIYLKKDFMSLKIPFKEMDIQMLSQKMRRLEYWFKEDTSNITDERLDHYNLLKKRISELKKDKIL